MTLLILGEGENEKLKTLKEYAEQHPVSLDDLFDQVNGERDSVGTMPEYTRHIPDGFKIVFSIEKQPPGDIRHMSVSCKKEAPPVEAVKLIIEKLGYKHQLESGKCHIYMEDVDDGVQAVNVIEII